MGRLRVGAGAIDHEDLWRRVGSRQEGRHGSDRNDLAQVPERMPSSPRQRCRRSIYVGAGGNRSHAAGAGCTCFSPGRACFPAGRDRRNPAAGRPRPDSGHAGSSCPDGGRAGRPRRSDRDGHANGKACHWRP